MSSYFSGNAGEVYVGFNFSDPDLEDNNKGIGGEKDNLKKIEGRVLNWESTVTKESPDCTLLGGVNRVSDEKMIFVNSNSNLTFKPSEEPPTDLYKTHFYTFKNPDNYNLYLQRRKIIDKNSFTHDMDSVYIDPTNKADNSYVYDNVGNESTRDYAERDNRAYLKNVGTSVLFYSQTVTTAGGQTESTPKFLNFNALAIDCDKAFRNRLYVVDPVSMAKMVEEHNDAGGTIIPNAATVDDIISEDSGIPLNKNTLYIFDHSNHFKQYQATSYSAEGSCELLFDASDLPTSIAHQNGGAKELTDLLDSSKLAVTGEGENKKQFSQSRLFAGMPILNKATRDKITDVVDGDTRQGRVIQFRLLFKKSPSDDVNDARGLAFNGHVISTEFQDVASDLLKVKVNFISSSAVTFYNTPDQ